MPVCIHVHIFNDTYFRLQKTFSPSPPLSNNIVIVLTRSHKHILFKSENSFSLIINGISIYKALVKSAGNIKALKKEVKII